MLRPSATLTRIIIEISILAALAILWESTLNDLKHPHHAVFLVVHDVAVEDGFPPEVRDMDQDLDLPLRGQDHGVLVAVGVVRAVGRIGANLISSSPPTYDC